jgi:hypothetical protein
MVNKEYGLPNPLFEELGNGIKVMIFRKVSNENADKVPISADKRDQPFRFSGFRRKEIVYFYDRA